MKLPAKQIRDPESQRNFEMIQAFLDDEFAGDGSPEGVVTANVGARYRRKDGGIGTTLYIKEVGNGTNTGWAPK